MGEVKDQSEVYRKLMTEDRKGERAKVKAAIKIAEKQDPTFSARITERVGRGWDRAYQVEITYNGRSSFTHLAPRYYTMPETMADSLLNRAWFRNSDKPNKISRIAGCLERMTT